MVPRLVLVVAFLVVAATTACDDHDGRLLVANPAGPEDGTRDRNLFVLTTDFETGSSSVLRLGGPTFRNVEPVAADSIARGFGREILVINRFGADNVQVLDAETVATTRQLSTGNGSNPQDVHAENGLFWVSLAERTEIDGRIVDGVAILDAQDGSLVDVIDLSPFAENADGLPRVGRMLAVGRTLLFFLQDFDSTFTIAHSGKVVFYDLDAREIVDADPETTEKDALDLSMRNPTAAAAFTIAGAPFVAVSAAGSAFPQELSGGIRVIDVARRELTSTFVDDDDLGGNLFDLEILSSSRGVVVVQGLESEGFPQRVATFDPTTGEILDPEVYRSGGGFLPDVSVLPDGRIAIAERRPEQPGVVLLDLDTGSREGPIDVGLPPFSFVLIDDGISVQPVPGDDVVVPTPTPTPDADATPTPTPTPDASCEVDPPASGDLYADRVVSFVAGAGSGFGTQAQVLGPPQGRGTSQGSNDVLSLGDGGSLVLELTDNRIVDGQGVDFFVYENPFYVGGDPDRRLIDAARVAVSEDGETFVTFPSSIDSTKETTDPARYSGFAGVEPVLPGDGPDCIGGDGFDLADVGLSSARFIRIEDPGDSVLDSGSEAPCSNNCGADIDAIGVRNHAP